MSIFPFRGRVGRANFAGGAIVCGVVFVAAIVAMVSALLSSPDFAAYVAKQHVEGWRPPPAASAAGSIALASIGGIALLLAFCSWLSFCIGRLHDLGCSGWAVLVVLFVIWAVPHDTGAWLVNAALMLVPGTTGSNKYGADPRVAATAVE